MILIFVAISSTKSHNLFSFSFSVQCDTNGSSEAANKSSIKCYVCSSVEDSDCANDPALAKFIMNCDDYFSNKSETFTATDKDYFCRKTVEMGQFKFK